jgi:hypothetical protein
MASEFEYIADGVYLRATPGGRPVYGEGYAGQVFRSDPYTICYAHGLWWVRGTDLASGRSGWSARGYLTEVSDDVSCCDRG